MTWTLRCEDHIDNVVDYLLIGSLGFGECMDTISDSISFRMVGSCSADGQKGDRCQYVDVQHTLVLFRSAALDDAVVSRLACCGIHVVGYIDVDIGFAQYSDLCGFFSFFGVEHKVSDIRFSIPHR